MACEMCGNQTVSSVVNVEGVHMQVCSACAKHGTLVRHLSASVKPGKAKSSRGFATAAPTKEEALVEQVRPETPALLRKHREKIGLTQEQFAAKLGIKLSTYHHYESGSSLPDIPTARKLEHVLKTGLVIKIQFGAQSTGPKEDRRGMQLGDFLRKR